METQELDIPGARLITPVRHADERGFFSEVYNRDLLAEHGITDEFVQDNHSLSVREGTLRGLHFQIPPRPISKLVRVVRGRVWDVVVDLRHGSPTFLKHLGLELSAESWDQIYVPIGCAHGFCTLEPNTEMAYKVSDYWSPAVDRGVAWNDPALGIEWPIHPSRIMVSDKDRDLPSAADLAQYFQWVGK